MLAYFLLIIAICVYQFGVNFIEHKNIRKILFITLTYSTIIIFTVLQKKLGPDYESYMNIYNTIAKTPWSEVLNLNLSIEPGFMIVNKMIASTGLNAEWYFKIYVAILIVCSGVICYKNSENPFMFTICMLSLMYGWFFILRQATATIIAMLGYGFVKRRKLLPYLVCVFLATSIHISGALTIVFYPLYYFYKNPKILRYLTISLCCIFVVFQKPLIELCKMLVQLIDKRYLHYFDNVEFAFNMTVILVGFIIMLMLLLDRSKKENNLAINYMFFALLLQTSSLLVPMAGRTMMMVYPLMSLALERVVVENEVTPNSKIIIATPGNERFIAGACLFAFMMFYWWYTYIAENPYVLMW